MSEIPDQAKLVRMYELMATTRRCDERIRTMLSGGQAAFMHYPPTGQEAIAAGLGVNLTRDDYMVTYYRSLHDAIAKGVSIRDIIAEYLGKATGPCKGKGGPMHLTDVGSGLMVSTAVVGSGMPIATGLALASVLREEDRVTVVSFGDGATNIGAFHESLNLASLWTLPVIFLCQNNQYAEASRFAMQHPEKQVSDRAAAYAMAGVRVDGNDPVAVEKVLREAIDRARAGGGPTLVEAVTYRFWGHYFGDGMTYMPKEERDEAMRNDPVPRYRRWLIDQGHAGEEELGPTEQRIADEVEAAIESALSSPDPDIAELTSDVYAGEGVPV
jgi:pyruvate dehydrogenase E1 component alpha subunit